jgi:hypothetical protein
LHRPFAGYFRGFYAVVNGTTDLERWYWWGFGVRERQARLSDKEIVNRIWEDAASIFETATATRDAGQFEIAILIDDQKSLRIVDASGWGLDALRREYQAATAYTVKRTASSVVVEGHSGSDHCTLKKTMGGNVLISLMGGGIPHHLLRPERMLLA